MQRFDVHILGCGSALPTMKHYPSSQVIDIRDKLFMIDCGEGAQLQFRKNRLRFNRLNHIFISHLHGDHCFGLIGLISTLALLGRTGNLFIHAVPDTEMILRPQLDYFCRDLPFEVKIEEFNPQKAEVIYHDRSVKVTAIPLNHRVPCAGFLFQEQEGDRHIIGDMIKFYDIPLKEVAAIKKGAGYTTPDGLKIPNDRLTKPADPARSYAYCSDTAYSEAIVPLIEGVDLLYHEATFSDEDAIKARMTGHSTAKGAAKIAQLANVKKLMLGHFSSRYEDYEPLLNEARQIFPNTMLANENMCEKL
ncbi:ribonuclease Z [Viscerimonas tarda]